MYRIFFMKDLYIYKYNVCMQKKSSALLTIRDTHIIKNEMRTAKSLQKSGGNSSFFRVLLYSAGQR